MMFKKEGHTVKKKSSMMEGLNCTLSDLGL